MRGRARNAEGRRGACRVGSDHCPAGCDARHRFSVAHVVRLVAAGWDHEQIQEEFLFIEAEDVQQALLYTVQCSRSGRCSCVRRADAGSGLAGAPQRCFAIGSLLAPIANADSAGANRSDWRALEVDLPALGVAGWVQAPSMQDPPWLNGGSLDHAVRPIARTPMPGVACIARGRATPNQPSTAVAPSEWQENRPGGPG